MRLSASILLALSASWTAAAPTAADYDYIVVGSGAGGGPLACRLAIAGFRTLLIEAGDDQGKNINYTVPGYQAAVTQDPKLRWDIFVNHYQDQDRAKRDPKYTYETTPFNFFTSVDNEPIPSGAKEKGILYPRAGTLGGCVSHNALIWITGQASDWNGIKRITGDLTWDALNLQGQILDKVYSWQPVAPTDPTILLRDLPLTQHLASGASVMGLGPPPLSAVTGLLGTLAVDPNSRLNLFRDATQGFFQVPLIQKGGARTSVRDFIVDTVAKGFPLTVQTDTHVTKILFDRSGTQPKATGVEYLQGKYLYRASPLSGGQGTRGSVNANKEVIISGGAFNTPQILKLSGIGPADELRRFNIPVVKDLPGVGKNMQDRYEIPVNVKHPKDFAILDGCTFDGKAQDACLKQWQNNVNFLAARGTYATNGFAATMAVNSKTADNKDIDMYIFGGPVNFNGYFPGWGDYAIRDHSYFSWYTLKAHAHNRAGTVELKSSDPLDPPLINFNYWDTGTTTNGADQKDLNAMIQALNMSRQALKEYSANYAILGGSPFEEIAPGPDVQTNEQIGQYIKDNSWGHHACCTAPIGADNDPNAVLDSKFRVRGVQGLRVVDASIFPSIPGIFIQAPIIQASEKAADSILKGL